MTEDNVAYILLLGGCDICKYKLIEEYFTGSGQGPAGWRKKTLIWCKAPKRLAGILLHPMHVCRWWEEEVEI